MVSVHSKFFHLADKLGRRILNIFSLFGSAVGFFAISLYQYLYLSGFDVSMFVWVPVVSLSFLWGLQLFSLKELKSSSVSLLGKLKFLCFCICGGNPNDGVSVLC